MPQKQVPGKGFLRPPQAVAKADFEALAHGFQGINGAFGHLKEKAVLSAFTVVKKRVFPSVFGHAELLMKCQTSRVKQAFVVFCNLLSFICTVCKRN